MASINLGLGSSTVHLGAPTLAPTLVPTLSSLGVTIASSVQLTIPTSLLGNSSATSVLPFSIPGLTGNNSTSSSAAIGPLFPEATNIINGLTSGIPLFVENVVPALLNGSGINLVADTLRSAWSPELVPIKILSGSQGVPDFDFSNVVNAIPVGQAFTLFASLPLPGSVISLPNSYGLGPNSTNSSSSTAISSTATTTALGSTATSANGTASSTAPASSSTASSFSLFTIPEGTFMTSQWSFYIRDSPRSSFIPAKLAANPTDPSGHYQILNGSLFSGVTGQSEYIFWPANSTSGAVRQVAACLNATFFVPGTFPAQTWYAPPSCLGGQIDSWTSVLGDISDGVISKTPNNLAFPSSLQNLFKVSIDTDTPSVGKPVTLSVLPIDQSTAILAPQIQSILDTTPDLHLSAAIDIGAPIDAVINALTKAVTSLFSPGSGAASTANNVASGVLNVANVLDGALSIPFALDVQGRQLVKTLTPAVGQDLLPNIAQIPGVSALQGALPIGKLVSTITSLANDITLVPQTENAIFNQKTVNGLHGLSLNFLPEFISAGSTSSSVVVIDVGLNASVSLPGFDGPLIQPFSLGSISITLPSVTLPQIALFFHDINYQQGDVNTILAILDPFTFGLASTTSQLTTLINDIVGILSQVRQLFPESLLGSLNAGLSTSIDNALAVAGTMANIIATNVTAGPVILETPSLTMPGINAWYADNSDWLTYHHQGISSFLYLGVDSGPGSNTMYMHLVEPNNQYPNNTWLYFDTSSNSSSNHLSGWLSQSYTTYTNVIASDNLMQISPGSAPQQINVAQTDIDNYIAAIQFLKQSPV